MQSQESSILNMHEPHPSGFSYMVLSNLTNHNTPTLSPHSHKLSLNESPIKKEVCLQQMQQQHSSQKINQQQQSNEKVNFSQLKQENQILKSQIELLKSAFLGIYKDQKTSLQFAPILQQIQQSAYQSQSNSNVVSENTNLKLDLHNFIMSLQQHQQQIQQSPLKAVNISPKKSQQPKQSKEILLPYGENNSFLLSSSPACKPYQSQKSQQSSTRRRRSDRQITNPITQNSNQNTGVVLDLNTTTNLTATPISQNVRSIVQEMDIAKFRLPEEGDCYNEEYQQNTIEKQEMQEDDEKIEEQRDQDNAELGQEQEFEEQNTNQKDSSQIQLKYQKMLEELEQQSARLESQLIQDRQVLLQQDLMKTPQGVSQEKSINEIKQQDDYVDILEVQAHNQNSNIQGFNKNATLKKRSYSSGCSRTMHLKNKKSCNFEQKQFYEQELNCLKNELEQFSKEEEKLLSIIESSRQLAESPQRSVISEEKQMMGSVKSSPGQSFRIHNHSKQEEDVQLEIANHKSLKFQFLQQQISLPQAPSRTPIKEYDHNKMCSFSQISFTQLVEANPQTQVVVVVEQLGTELTDAETQSENGAPKQLLIKSTTQEQMLLNLAEASKYLMDDRQQDDICFMKPVKIASPNRKHNFDPNASETASQTQLRVPQAGRNNQSLLPKKDYADQRNNKTPKIKKRNFATITPVRSQQANMHLLQEATSADRLQKRLLKQPAFSISEYSQQAPLPQQINKCPSQQQLAIQYHSKKTSVHSITSHNPPSIASNPTRQGGNNSNMKQRPTNNSSVLQYVPHQQSQEQNFNKKTNNSKKKSSHKKFSIHQIFKTMSNNASPLKQVMKSERRYKECLTTDENEEEESAKIMDASSRENGYLEDNYNREHALHTLEMLSKRQSLANGLTQQQEPDTSLEEERLLCQQLEGDQQPQYELDLEEKPIQIQYSQQQLKQQQTPQSSNKKNFHNQNKYSTNKKEKVANQQQSSQKKKQLQKKQSPYKRVSKQQQQQESFQSEEDLFESGNYFGIYSKERSDQLKNQREESIKKAEELLSQFIVQKSNRPQFLNSVNKPLQLSSSKREDLQVQKQKQEVNTQKEEELEEDIYKPQQIEEDEEKVFIHHPKKYISDDHKVTIRGEQMQREYSQKEDFKSFGMDSRVMGDYRGSQHIFDEEMLNQNVNNSQSQAAFCCDNSNINNINESKSIISGGVFINKAGSNMNEISFQHNQGELCQVSFVRSQQLSSKNSKDHSRSNSCSRGGQQPLFNIEIPALLRSPQKIQQQKESPVKSVEPTFECLKKEAMFDNKKQNQSSPSPQRRLSGLDNAHSQQVQHQDNTIKNQAQTFLNNRRKSHELSKHGILSQQKKSTLVRAKQRGVFNDQVSPISTNHQVQNKTMLQHTQQHQTQSLKPNQLQQTTSQTAFQKFSSGVTSLEKTALQARPKWQDCCQQISYAKDQQHFSNTYVDAEELYEQRSKSVVKRREELQRKKAEQQRSKIEAKYQKIENLRQTRNERLSGVCNNQCSNAANVPTKQVVAILQRQRKQQQQQCSCCCDQQSSSSYIGMSEAPTFQDDNNANYLSINESTLNNQTKHNQQKLFQETLNKFVYQCSAINNNIMSETEEEQQFFNKMPKSTLSECIQQQPSNSLLIEGSSSSQNNMRGIDKLSSQKQQYKQQSIHTTNCKTSMIISESSTFRQLPSQEQVLQQLNVQNQADRQTIQPQIESNKQFERQKTPTCNLAYKKAQSALKQSIVNRTMRINGAQSNNQHKFKNNPQQISFGSKMQQTIDVSAYNDQHSKQSLNKSSNNQLDKSQLLNSTLAGSQSFINTTNKITNCSQYSDNNSSKTICTTTSNNGCNPIKGRTQSKVNSNLMSSSRSNKRIVTPNSNNLDNNGESVYGAQYNSKNAGNQKLQVHQTIVLPSEKIKDSSNQHKNCLNCQRLVSKGLSKDFCLSHITTPKYCDQ